MRDFSSVCFSLLLRGIVKCTYPGRKGPTTSGNSDPVLQDTHNIFLDSAVFRSALLPPGPLDAQNTLISNWVTLGKDLIYAILTFLVCKMEAVVKIKEGMHVKLVLDLVRGGE